MPPNDTTSTTVQLQEQTAATKNLTQDTANLAQQFVDLNKITAEYAQTVASLVITYPALKAAQDLYNDSLYKAIIGSSVEMAKIPRLLTSEIMGANVLLSENMNSANDAMTRNALAMQRAAYADQETLIDRQVKIGEANGKAIMGHMLDYFKTSAELGEAFYRGAMDETRLYDAALQATTELGQEKLYRMKETSALAMKGLEMNVNDMTAIFQEEFSKTGKISGDLVEKFSATILAASKETGLGLRQLTEDSTRMLKDVEHFGNMTYAQMTSLSAAVHRLGLDMDDVTRVTEKFVSFENASQAIANIGAVTGATLDTMEMFYLANEDKEEFFRTMRQSLLDQGVTLENLSHQEQVYLSRQMGFNSVRQLQSLLNEEIDFTTGNISDKIAEAAEGQEYVGDQLSSQLAQAGGLAEETLKALSPDGILERNTAIRNLAGGTSLLFDSTVKLNASLSSMADDGVEALRKAGQSFSEGFIIAMDEVMKSGGALLEWWKNFVEKAVPDAAKRRSVPKMYEPVTEGMTELVKEAEKILNKLPESNHAAFKASSKAAIESVVKTSTDSAATFDKLRKEHESKIKDINKFEKDLLDEQKARMSEVQKVEEAMKNQQLSYKTDEAYANIQERFGGGAGEKLTDADVEKLFKGLVEGNASVVTDIVMGGMSDKLKAAAAQLGLATGSTPTATPPTSVVPTSAPVVAGAEPAGETAPAARGAAVLPTTADGNLNIKVKLELDKTDLIKMITTEILPDVISGGIRIPAGTPGKYAAGGDFNFVLESP